MRPSLFRRDVLPFIARMLALLAAALLTDAGLHLINAIWIGRFLGIPGVLLILASFGHSLRKRGWIKGSDTTRLLRLHEWLAWAGSLLVLVHAGIHFNAALAWLAAGAMLVVITSGLTGKYLLRQVLTGLRDTRTELLEAGIPEAEVRERLQNDSLTVDIIRQWRAVHLPISLAFGVLGSAHIIAILLFWAWR